MSFENLRDLDGPDRLIALLRGERDAALYEAERLDRVLGALSVRLAATEAVGDGWRRRALAAEAALDRVFLDSLAVDRMVDEGGPGE